MPNATRALCALVLAVAAGCAASQPRPVVVLMTDFGTKDDAAALLRGTVLSIARDAQVLDLTHEVPAYDVEAGARALEDAPGVFPPGTVFVAVVDPGVGTDRRPLAVELGNGSYLVGPDNGLLSLAMAKHGVRAARAIEDRRFMRATVSPTFHGRDLFSPAGAHLAAGDPPFREIGPEVKTWLNLALPPAVFKADPAPHLEGRVISIDQPFGNIWTNITEDDLAKLGKPAPKRLLFELGDPVKKVAAPLVLTFGDVPEGQPLAYWNSRNKLSLALNLGDAATTYAVRPGTSVAVSPAP